MSLLVVLFWILLAVWVVVSLYTLLLAAVSMIRLCDGEFSPETAPPMIHRVLQALAIVAALLAALHTGVFWLRVTLQSFAVVKGIMILLPCAAVAFVFLLILSWRRDSWDRVRPLLWSALLTVSSGALCVLVFAFALAAAHA